MERLVKGTHIAPILEHVEQKYDAERRARFHEALSEPTRLRLADVSRNQWYPVELVAEIWHAVFIAQGDDPQRGYDELVRMGTLIAEEATSTFMRLLVKLMNPKLLARKWPDFWAKSHNFGRMSSDASRLENNELVLNIADVDGYHHIAATAVGFVSHAFRSMGIQECKVVETRCPIGEKSAPEYRIEVRW